jgi:shikimate dehydrogenase
MIVFLRLYRYILKPRVGFVGSKPMIERYAVMGYPVAHSLSPVIHQLFAKQTGRTLVYDKIQIDLSRFEQQVCDFFQQGGKGLNITLPCKQRAFAMSDHRCARCLEAGAVNTLWMQDGRLHADNTDGVGLLRDISRYVHLTGKNILLLGAGGAARGILRPLILANPAELTICNRTPERARALQLDFALSGFCSFAELDAQVEKKSYDVVINATSASIDDQGLALPAALMAAKPFCYDLAYSRTTPTAFVASARAFGCVAIDGLGMLVEQAAEAFFIWHGVMPSTAPVLSELLRARSLLK